MASGKEEYLKYDVEIGEVMKNIMDEANTKITEADKWTADKLARHLTILHYKNLPDSKRIIKYSQNGQTISIDLLDNKNNSDCN